MTLLNNYTHDEDNLKELLIKNLPSSMKAGYEKTEANIFNFKTVVALDRCKFINFNTEERISFMIFDFDTYKDKKAIETFKNIDMFYNYLIKKVGLEPTYILQTDKGFHFAYHLKNHIYTKQKKAFNYLNNIKKGIIEKVGCDSHGSIRNYGVWRNPLLHTYYFSEQVNYELSDFKDLAIPRKTLQQKFKRDIVVRQFNQGLLMEGNRNNLIFLASMSWAKNQKNLQQGDIEYYATEYNKKAEVPLENKEIKTISRSVFKYYVRGKIYIHTNANSKNINEGAMELPKISGLTYFEYKIEVKKRQKLSAQRTNEIVGKEKKKELMLNAKKYHIEQLKNRNLGKIEKAKIVIAESDKKITISEIARLTGLDRKTVRKYM